MRAVLLKLNVFFLIIFCIDSKAQGTLDDYLRSDSVETLFADKVYNAPTSFNWTADNSLWYVNNSREGNTYLLVSNRDKSQKLAFDHGRLAESLSSLLGKKFSPELLDLKDLNFNKDQSLLNFTCDSLIISAKLDTYDLKIEGIVKKKNERRPFWPSLPNELKKDSVESPDKTHIAYIKNSNLYIKSKSQQEEIQMSFDGNNGFFYSSNIYWSPDSKKIIAYKLRPRQEHKVHYIETSPSDQLQPKLFSRDYLKPVIQEMELFQEAGFHPLEVIRGATLHAAEAIFEPKGKPIEFGIVRPGLLADLVIVDENPIENLKTLYGTGFPRLNDDTGKVEKVGGVKYTIKDGIVYDAKQLLRDVEEMVNKQKEERRKK